MYEGMPDEVRQRLPHDVRLYMANLWQHPNDPTREYDFYDNIGPAEDEDDEEGEFLTYLAHDDGPLVPENLGDINILNFCRGGLKTTTAVAYADWTISQFPISEVDITAPRQEQFSEVMDRFKSAVKHSGMHQLRTKDNISHQKFERVLETEDGSEVEVESDVKARSAWGSGDALRGLHGHLGIIDEFQDVDEGMFSTFLEAVDQGVPDVDYFPSIMVIGTPKMANSFFHELWKMSDQKTWDDEAEEWVVQDEADEFLPQDLKDKRRELRREVEEDIEVLHGAAREADDRVPDTLEALTSEIERKSQAADAIEGYTVRGWHIDQYACPLHDEGKIEFKRQKYSEKKFKNEVLAEFYTPENDLLSDKHVKAAFDDAHGFQPKRQYDDSKVTIGVDWGGGESAGASETVIVVTEQIRNEDDPRLVVRDITFVDQDASKQREIEIVEERIRDYEADAVAVDEGYGSKQREDLQNGRNIWKTDGWDQVCSVIYGSIKDKDEPKFQNSGYEDSSYCTVARTHMVEQMVADFKDGRIDIPAADLSDGRDGERRRLLDQLTAPYTDRSEGSTGKRQLRVESDRNDDAFHAFVYAWIAANKFGTRRTLKSIGTHDRAGVRGD